MRVSTNSCAEPFFEASAKQTVGIVLLGLAATWFFGKRSPARAWTHPCFNGVLHWPLLGDCACLGGTGASAMTEIFCHNLSYDFGYYHILASGLGATHLVVYPKCCGNSMIAAYLTSSIGKKGDSFAVWSPRRMR